MMKKDRMSPSRVVERARVNAEIVADALWEPKLPTRSDFKPNAFGVADFNRALYEYGERVRRNRSSKVFGMSYRERRIAVLRSRRLVDSAVSNTREAVNSTVGVSRAVASTSKEVGTGLFWNGWNSPGIALILMSLATFGYYEARREPEAQAMERRTELTHRYSEMTYPRHPEGAR